LFQRVADRRKTDAAMSRLPHLGQNMKCVCWIMENLFYRADIVNLPFASK
jgi:hypothetical protein